jgi:transposase
MGTVIGGVDTHSATHHAAIIDSVGRFLASQEFSATPAGYSQMLAWMRGHGTLNTVGVEGCGAYGAGLARHFYRHGVDVIEVPRPDRRLRRNRGKSDPIDAEAAARSVLAGTATVQPKLADGPIEAIRALRIARVGAVKAKTASTNALKAMVITAPEPLRTQLTGLTAIQLVNTCIRFRPNLCDLENPTQATKAAMRSIATRARHLIDESRALKRQLDDLTRRVAPTLTKVFALGPETAAALLVTIGDNPDRLRSEAAFAHLCGVAPIPASSGKTSRHRLHRGGDRSANRALHLAVVVRLRYCERTRVYVTRRISEGKTMLEIIRCLKRYLAREIYNALRTDYAALMT